MRIEVVKDLPLIVGEETGKTKRLMSHSKGGLLTQSRLLSNFFDTFSDP